MLHISIRKTITIVLLSISVIFIISFLIHKDKPAEVLREKINLQLPSNSSTEKFYYNKLFKTLDAKIRLNEADLECVKKDLANIFKEEYKLESESYILNIGKYKSWWNIDINDVIVCYSSCIDGEKFLFFPSAKTQEIWSILAKENEEYYLYITWF